MLINDYRYSINYLKLFQLLKTIEDSTKCGHRPQFRPKGQTSECQFASRMHQNLHCRTSLSTVQSPIKYIMNH